MYTLQDPKSYQRFMKSNARKAGNVTSLADYRQFVPFFTSIHFRHQVVHFDRFFEPDSIRYCDVLLGLPCARWQCWEPGNLLWLSYVDGGDIFWSQTANIPYFDFSFADELMAMLEAQFWALWEAEAEISGFD